MEIIFCFVFPGDDLETMCFVVFQAELPHTPAPGLSGFPTGKPRIPPCGFSIGKPQGGTSECGSPILTR